MVAAVLGPVLDQDPPLLHQLVVGLRSGKGGQDQELYGVDFKAPREFHRLADGLDVVLVGTQHEHAMDPDAVFMYRFYRIGDILDGLLLPVTLQGTGVYGFQAKIQK